MKMECPHCGVSGTVDDSLVGRKVRCPKCVDTFEVGAEGSDPIEAEAIDLEAYSDEALLSEKEIISDGEEDLDISDLLRSEASEDDEFPSEKCDVCGIDIHPALLMDVDSKMYCAGCVPPHLLSDVPTQLFSEEEKDEGEVVEAIGEDRPASDSTTSSLNEETVVAPVREEEESDQKESSGTFTKLLLLCLLIALAGGAAMFFLDIKLF